MNSYIQIKNLLISTCLLLISMHVFSQKTTGKNDYTTIEKIFHNPKDAVQTSVYWYWLSGNVSKEGVVKDLEAMKKVGINRAFIGDIGLNDIPYGKVKFRSEEWWDILHMALKTATRLNIEIGMFNGPGWSQSGGPWVKAEQSMRYLNSSQRMVKGPGSFHEKLEKPQEKFQDVKVLAYPVPDDYGSDISVLKPKLSSNPSKESLDNLMDNNEETGVNLTAGQGFSLDIKTGDPYTLRSLTVTTKHNEVYLEGDVQSKINDEYVTVKHFIIDRRRSAINFGFRPWAKAIIGIPVTTSKELRILFTRVDGNSGISELKLSSTAMMDSFSEKTLAKALQSEDLNWDAYLWNPQPEEKSKYNIDPEKVVDVSSYMDTNGTFTWKVPAGNWIIERTGMSPTNMHNGPATPEATGFETDKMSKEHIRAHFDAYLGEVLKRIPAEDRKTFKVVVADSYETGSQNWTDLLLKEFKKKYKYDPTPFIPVLQGKVVGNTTISDRFLWDLRRLLADDAAFKYVGGLTEVSHEHGLTTWLENYGYFGFPAEFLQYGGQADEVSGEFWLDGRLGTVENKAASSAAHIYGKNKVSAESWTSAGAAWRAHPANLKARGDRFFADGINNTLLHVFIHQPEINPTPGLSAWFGTEFNRGNTWFYDMDVFLEYIKRCNLLLQQGHYAADAIYFIGEDAPKLMGVTDPALPNGYSYDYINADVIRDDLSVKDGKLVLDNGMNYSILVLPNQTSMRPELLAKIKELVQNGAVVLGPKPERSPSLEDYPKSDELVKSMANELWGKDDGIKKNIHHYGKGLVLNDMTMQEALDYIKIIPDFETTENTDGILYTHRKLKDGSIYFISNQKNKPISFTAEFRVTGKKPELWNPLTGRIRELPEFNQIANKTTIPLHLAQNESAFIFFRIDGTRSDSQKSNYPIPYENIELTKPWTVTFNSTLGGPENSVIFNKLTDWSLNPNDSIKYYSGAAVYQNDFVLDKKGNGTKFIIDLGVARNIAKIKLNGMEIGGVWTPPYQLDITEAIKQGLNKLEIKVVNNWANRILGDALLPEDQRKTAPLFAPAGTELESSGLLGPVEIGLFK